MTAPDVRAMPTASETPREIGLRRELSAERKRRQVAEQAHADVEIEADRLLAVAAVLLADRQARCPEVARESIARGLGDPEAGLRDKVRGVSERDFGKFLADLQRMLT